MKIGDRIELVSTDDEYSVLKPGDQGTVDYVGADTRYGDPDQIGVTWDSGSTLILLDGFDSYKILDV